MKRMRIVVILAVGIAIGYGACMFLSPNEKAPNPQSHSHKPPQLIADSGESATIRALRARIAELERALAERATAMPAGAATNEVARANPFDRGHGRDPRKFFEELKKSDPARYAQMTNRMAQRQQRRAARMQSRMEYLSSIDVSHMSASAKKAHSDLQELLAAREELEQRMRNPDLTEDERHALFDEMREMNGKLGELNRQERSNLLEATVRELGFTGNDVKDIATAVQDVIEATEGGRGGGPGGGPGEAPPPAR